MHNSVQCLLSSGARILKEDIWTLSDTVLKLSIKNDNQIQTIQQGHRIWRIISTAVLCLCLVCVGWTGRRKWLMEAVQISPESILDQRASLHLPTWRYDGVSDWGLELETWLGLALVNPWTLVPWSVQVTECLHKSFRLIIQIHQAFYGPSYLGCTPLDNCTHLYCHHHIFVVSDSLGITIYAVILL